MKIFKKFPAFFLIFIIWGIQTSADPLDSILTEDSFVFVVDSIEIFGNDITEPEIILRELTFKLGDSVSTHMVEYNQERIYSLGIFTKVVILPTEVNDTKILRITVEESWYIYPLPLAEIKDRDWKKFSYGFDVIVQNFRGRNEFVRSRVTLGYDKSVLLGYHNPYLIWEDNIFFDANISYRHVANRSRIAEEIVQTSFEQKFSTLSVSSGKRIGLFHRLSANLSFNYIETPFFVSGISASDERIDRIFAIGGAYSYDTRDLAQFPKEGILGILSFQLKGLGINNINYQILNLDFREYRHLAGDLIAKWRLASRNTFGNVIPYYDFSFLGYSERVRGHINNVIEGNHLYVGSLELFYPILKDITINLDFIPIIPRQLLTYRIAIYAQIFGDTGIALLKRDKISINNFQKGFGAGLTLLILPYNILRVELGFNEFLDTELILDLGISF